MSEIPGWWLAISAAFFIVNILLFIALGIAAFQLVKVMKGFQPKIDQLTQRVDNIGERVEELTTHVKTTVEQLGGRATSVATSVDNIAHVASRQFEKFSPFIVGAMTAIRLVKALNEARQGRSLAKATRQKDLDPKKAKQAAKR